MKTSVGKLFQSAMLSCALWTLAPAVTPVAHADTFTSFDFPNAVFTSGLGLNSRGDIVGRYRREPWLSPERWGFQLDRCPWRYLDPLQSGQLTR